MYIDPFVLTEGAPAAEPARREIVLGRTSDGHFVVERFPANVAFGVYLEVAFEEGETGDFDLRLVAEAVVPGYPRRLLFNTRLSMPPASADWWAPRIRPLAFEAEVYAGGEFDAQLLVEIDGEDEALAAKTICIRAHPAAN